MAGAYTYGAMKKSERGFTLVETVFSVALLTIAILGLATAIPVAVQTNHRNRVDSEGAMLVQKELEQIATQPLTSSSFTDANGNSVSLAAGGNTLANGQIDFDAAAVAGYNATVTGNAGAQYQLRWNVQSLADGSKQFTMAARRTGGQRFLLPPVNLSLRQGR